MVATSFSKRRQQAPKPRGSPDIVLHAEALAVDEAEAASKVPLRQGAGDSAGVRDPTVFTQIDSIRGPNVIQGLHRD